MLEGIGGGFIVVVVVALVIAGVIWSYYFEKKRREALAAWARGRGVTFDPTKRRGTRYDAPIFGRGHSRWSRYHMTGVIEDAVPGLGGAGVDLFEYHYAITSGSGKNRSTRHYYFSCIAADVGVDLGHVEIREEHFGDWLAQTVGFDDIDFEDAEFSKRFMVKATDRREAFALIETAMMRFLLAWRGVYISTHGRSMFVYMKGRVKPERCAQLMEFVDGFTSQVPRTLVNGERSRRGLGAIMEAGAAAAASREMRGS